MNRQELIQRAAMLKWFHVIDFGDYQSSGRFPRGTKQNVTPFPVMALLEHIDLRGLTCYDIGTANGLSAFGMKLKGAARVVATDVGEVGEPFALARELLALDVEYVANTSFDNILAELPEHSADLMVCAGVMYHMLNPFDCILKARGLLRRRACWCSRPPFTPRTRAQRSTSTPSPGASRSCTPTGCRVRAQCSGCFG
jgi:tRNA (mo5U34)-methyltransferase